MAQSSRVRPAMALAAAVSVWLFGVGLAGTGRTGTGEAPFGGSDDPAAIDRIIKIGTTDNQAMDHLGYLCNAIGARPAGGGNDRQAREWARAKFEQFGLANAHLEECGEIPSGFFEAGRTRASAPTKLYNVVADIPGTLTPDEYVIVGAHLDSTPRGTGATDNATGVAAVMEAARLLMEAGAKPARTIRFILFAGEEAGLVGSTGYMQAHPDLVPKITAMYNMDQGSDYISGISATVPLLADLETVFAPASRINPAMPFAVRPVDYLTGADANVCKDAVASQADGNGGPMWVTKKVFKRNPDGSLEEVDADSKILGITEEDIKRGVDSQGRKLVRIEGSCGGEGIDLGDSTNPVQIKMVAMGSSDQTPFLGAGIPSFWWGQGDTSAAAAPYPFHTDADTFDKVVPRSVEHSATVIALGALGTADLDHMLSRERLTAPADSATFSP